MEFEAFKTYRLDHDRSLRERILVEHASLVKYLAGRIAVGLPPHIDVGDLEGYGVLGLIDALEKFDPSRGIKFETYAAVRIRGAILDGLRAQDPAPPVYRQRQKLLDEAYHQLEAKLGRFADDSEVAEHLGVSVNELSNWHAEVAALNLTSLDEIWHESRDGSDRSLTGIEILQDERMPGPEEKLCEGETCRLLAEAVERLPEKERLVITLCYYEKLTAKEVAGVLEVTPSRISQLHSRAITRLKAALSPEVMV